MNDNQVTALANAITGDGWVATGLRTDGSMAALDATTTPTDALSSAGLGFLTAHVQPLQDVVDQMAGRAPVIHSFADAWQQVSAQVDQVQQHLARSAETDTAQWHGEARERYRTHVAELTAALSHIVELAKATNSATTTMGQALAGGRQQAGDLLTDLVQRLISFVSHAVAAEGGVTSNVLTQATNMISSYSSPISTIEQQVRQTIGNVQPLLTALANAMSGAPIATSAADAQPSSTPAGVEVAALGAVTMPENTRGLGGLQLAQATDSSNFLDSLRGGATIHLPDDGGTIRMRPGGEYIIPPGSKIIRDGEEILNDKLNPRGFNMRDDGTRVRVEDVPSQ